MSVNWRSGKIWRCASIEAQQGQHICSISGTTSIHSTVHMAFSEHSIAASNPAATCSGTEVTWATTKGLRHSSKDNVVDREIL